MHQLLNNSHYHVFDNGIWYHPCFINSIHLSLPLNILDAKVYLTLSSLLFLHLIWTYLACLGEEPILCYVVYLLNIQIVKRDNNKVHYVNSWHTASTCVQHSQGVREFLHGWLSSWLLSLHFILLSLLILFCIMHHYCFALIPSYLFLLVFSFTWSLACYISALTFALWKYYSTVMLTLVA